MNVLKESEGSATWAKLGFAFVAGLVLAGVGATIVIKSLVPKAAPAGHEVAQVIGPATPTGANATPPAGPGGETQDKAAQAEAPTQGPASTPEVAPPQPRKSHPSAFGDTPAKRVATLAHNSPPLVRDQDQTTPNTTKDPATPNAPPPGGVAQQQPQYAPAPDVAPVIPQTAQATDRSAQPEVRPDTGSSSTAQQPQTVTIDAGTSLMVRIGETISTKTKVVGDSFRGTMDQPLILNGFIIADKGSKVAGRIVSAQKGGHLSGSSDLSLQVTEIHTTDGQTVHLETSPWEKKGESNTGGNVAKIGGGAVLGAIIGGIAGGGKGAAIGAGAGGAAGTGVAAATGGKPTVVPVETVIAFRVNTPVTITEQINN